jgi:hypothetical protein
VLSTKLPSVGTIDVTSAGALSGHGTVTSLIADAGLINATGGTLTLSGATSGAGTLGAASGAKLALSGGGTFAGALSGAGSIVVAKALTLTAGASLAASAITIGANVALAAGENATNSAGDTLTLSIATSETIDFSAASTDTFTNAGTGYASGAGTEEFGVAVINSGQITSSTGTLRFLDAVTNTGTISETSGLLSIATTVAGTGTLDVGATGTLSLLLGASTGQTVDFTATTGLLDLTKPADFLGAISGFGASDVIDLRNTAETTFTVLNNVLTVFDGATKEATLNFSGAYTSNSFTLGTDGAGGTFVKFV